MMSINKIAAEIKNRNNFLITSHVNLEGDALGSELAFYRLLKLLGKTAVIVNEDDVPYGYEFFSGLEVIKKYKPDLKELNFDCMAVLDCSDFKRTGEVYKLNTENKPVFNIDHHISNTYFGNFNLVNPKASSCCEVIYQLYKKLNITIDEEAALALYTGILTDTGSFHYSNTGSSTHKITARLLKCGIDVSRIYKSIYGNFPFNEMKLVIKILSKVKRRHRGKIIWCRIDGALLKKYRPRYVDLTDSVMGYCRTIKDMEVAVLFKENLGKKREVRVNFRSEGKVDVNKVAGFFGGGGHKSASGCTIQGGIDEVIRKVLRKVEESMA